MIFAAKLDHVRWLAARLGAMSPPEIVYRVRQFAFRKWAARRNFDFSEPPDASLKLPDLAGSIAMQPSRTPPAQYAALGKAWPDDAGHERWHRDPESGGLWPDKTFCFTIDFRHREDMGDPKYVWERNRLQHLQFADAGTCVEEIESWIDANPAFLGINWAAAIEMSMRVLSIAIITSRLADECFSPGLRRKIRSALRAHGYWLEKNQSLFSSANNHLIVEAAGLFLIGASTPDLPDAARWERMGRDILEREALLQFAADGGNKEQAIAYGAWSLEWLKLCAALAETRGRPFSSPVLERLELARRVLSALSDEAGNFPRFGDDDDATAVWFDGSREAWFASVCGLATEPREPFRHFPESGLTVMRRNGSHAVFDHGPLGYLSIAAHGHADALSVWLHRHGQPVLVDCGTFTYGGARAARGRYRGTAAHNTLCFEGRNSSTISGPFNWSKHARCRATSVEPSAWKVVAEHDGYGLLHRRSVELQEHALIVTDWLSGSGSGGAVDIAWHLAPGLSAMQDRSSIKVLCEGAALMTVTSAGPLEWKIGEAHYSPRMGSEEKIARLSLCGALPPDTNAVTRFAFDQ